MVLGKSGVRQVIVHEHGSLISSANCLATSSWFFFNGQMSAWASSLCGLKRAHCRHGLTLRPHMPQFKSLTTPAQTGMVLVMVAPTGPGDRVTLCFGGKEPILGSHYSQIHLCWHLAASSQKHLKSVITRQLVKDVPQHLILCPLSLIVNISEK